MQRHDTSWPSSGPCNGSREQVSLQDCCSWRVVKQLAANAQAAAQHAIRQAAQGFSGAAMALSEAPAADSCGRRWTTPTQLHVYFTHAPCSTTARSSSTVCICCC
jgi:hypothetical protein